MLRDLLEGSLARPRLEGQPSDLDADAVQKLQALGYLAGSETELPQSGADLKRMLPHYNVLVTAHSFIGSGRVSAAVPGLLSVAEADPGNPRCMWLLAEAVATDPAAAADAFAVVQRAAADSRFAPPARVAFLIDCARGYLRARRPAEAVSVLLQAIEVMPNSAFAHSWLGIAYLHLGRTSPAVEASLEATRLVSGVDFLSVQLGLAYICDGQAAKGAAVWHELLNRSARPASVWELADRCAQDAVICARAEQPLMQAAGDSSLPAKARAAAWAGVGEIAFGTGRLAESLRAFQSARELLTADDSSLLWWTARVLTRLGKPEEAANFWPGLVRWRLIRCTLWRTWRWLSINWVTRPQPLSCFRIITRGIRTTR